jgi:hypothetical protein
MSLRRAFLIVLLASIALGLAPPATCEGPWAGNECHERDPATDHDGQESEQRTCR